ncbi:ATPase [Nocardia gipuzkoensis]
MKVENPSVPTGALFIGGRSGVGKSSVGLEVHAQLSAAGVRHCLIEGDFLDMAYPPTWEHGLAERNLAGMWTNYRALGYRRMVYTNTASVLDEVVDQLIAAMGDSPTVVGILLTCTEETARQRLSQREIGSALDAHLERSADMAHRLDIGCRPGVHRVVTDGRAIAEIAAEIIRLSGWLPRESPRLVR